MTGCFISKRMNHSRQRFWPPALLSDRRRGEKQENLKKQRKSEKLEEKVENKNTGKATKEKNGTITGEWRKQQTDKSEMAKSRK